MLNIENDSNSICEEPQIYYYSSSSNFGVGAMFSERNLKTYKAYTMDITSCPDKNNNNFSLYNTIMLPHIMKESSSDSKQNISYNNNNNNNKNNNNNNISKTPNEKINPYLKKDNTRIKTDSSKDEKNISDEKQLTNTLIEIKETNDSINKKEINNKESIALEENPFFLGKNSTLCNYNNNSKIKKNIKDNNTNNNNSNEKNDSETKEFLGSGPCKSVICDDKKRKKSIKDDDKSENLIKKSKKLNLKRDFLNTKPEYKREKSIKERYLKKKSFFIQLKYNKKEIDKEEELTNKKDKDKDKFKSDNKHNKNIKEPRSKSYYYSNKFITHSFNQNLLKTLSKKKKSDNSNNNNNININIEEYNYNDEKYSESKKNNKLRSQKNNKLNKQKNSKDDNKKINTNKSSRYKLSQVSKGIKLFKEKDNGNDDVDADDNSSKEKSFNLKKNKKSDVKNKRYNSKNEIKRIKLNNKDSDKEKKIKNQKNLEKMNLQKIKENNKIFDNNLDEKDEKKSKEKFKIFSCKQQIIIEEKDNNESNKNKINKCLTADLVRKKSFNTKYKNAISPSKKKIPNMIGINLFADNKNKKKKNIDFEFALKNNLKKMQFNLFSKDKFTNTEFSDSDYLKYTLECMDLILDLDMEKQTRLKNQINFNFPKPKKNKIKKRIALFDLDETIVHCTGDIKTQKDKYQHAVEIKLPGKQAVEVGINIRPYWKQTLNLIKKNYHIVIYTASHQAYADSVLDFMDPKKKYFKYRLYRNNCSLVDVDGAKFYVKDLDILTEHYDLKDIVIVDNSVLSFSFHLHNGIPIVPYYDEDKDGSLYVVGLYLMHIFKEDDLREANKKQINLDSFMEEAKKRKEEEYIDVNQIDEESECKEDDENNNDNNNNINNDNEKNDKNENISSKRLSKKSIDLESKTSEKKKFSEKKLHLVKKRSSNFLNIIDHHNEQNNDFAQKKLMSQSKLINMYYEVKDKSTKNDEIIDNLQEKIKKKSNLNEQSTNNIEKNNTNQTTIVFVDNDDEELDCKSDPGNFHNDQNNISDNESSEEDKEAAILKRVYTIIEDNPIKDSDLNSGDKTTKNNSRTKLGFIRSNFFNNFKI